jgi:hypothetical protein
MLSKSISYLLNIILVVVVVLVAWARNYLAQV